MPNPLDQCRLRCRWSTNLTDYEKSNAVVFHLENKDFVFSMSWVLIAREPQSFYYPEQLKRLDDKFNLTITFQYDSDVVIPYGQYEELSPATKALVANLHTNNLSGKSRTITWLASNCFTSSRREEYVKELQKLSISMEIVVT